jgi:predicted nuclease of predicted toxin-antitoxin system
MKFLVDAQLPRRLAYQLKDIGFDAVHTLDLPVANRTSDAEINNISINEKRIVITKDADFVNSFHLQKKPWKLLLVSTGNIGNVDLEAVFLANIEIIAKRFGNFDFIS